MINSTLKNSIDKKEHLTRHLDLIDVKRLDTPITIIGAGGIGSWVTFALAKMGFSKITVYDYDRVAIENVGNQLYSFKDVGLPKVLALKDMCKGVGADIKAMLGKFDFPDGAKLKGIVIAAVDSMETRKLIAKAIPDDCFLIDGRMGAEKILVYTSQGHEQRATYEKSLYPDKNAEQAPCTAKATSYCALTISGLIVGQVKSFIQGAPTLKHYSMDAANGACIRFSH